MFVFILIVLVLAALFGVLGVVLKATAIVLFTLLLVFAILGREALRAEDLGAIRPAGLGAPGDQVPGERGRPGRTPSRSRRPLLRRAAHHRVPREASRAR